MAANLYRLLMAPALAGALLGVSLGLGADGSAEAAGPPRWKSGGKPAEVDCRFTPIVKKTDDPSSFYPVYESGSVCAIRVRYGNKIGIWQKGKFNQANAALNAQNIFQNGNSPNGDVTNEANDNYNGFGNNQGSNSEANLIQANVNINKNHIKKAKEGELISVEIGGD